jgi:formamidopyrimidine-DNA glycosylase
MPELPEVETIRQGLARLVKKGTVVERVEVGRLALRRPYPRGLDRKLAGRPLLGFGRHGKVLEWRVGEWVLLSHLGMTGTWRRAEAGDVRVHDHCRIELASGLALAYHDPRRFGSLGLARSGRERLDPALRSLGPDPLAGDDFSASYLGRAFAGRRAPVKALLLDQRLVAGLGNIYVAEALHLAGIRPGAPAGSLSAARLEALAAAVRSVLVAAVGAGGSTLRDYRQADGAIGRFQEEFRVYGRDGHECCRCGHTLRSERLGGRATVWCPRCQR